MPTINISGVLRDILSSNLELPTDDVITRAKARGVTLDRRTLQKRIHNTRSELRKSKGQPAAKPAPAAAKPAAAKPAAPSPKPSVASAPKPAAKKPASKLAAQPAASSGTPNLGIVLGNVAKVNKVITACGSPDVARQVAEAVKACGGVEPFLKHLELVAGIRTENTK